MAAHIDVLGFFHRQVEIRIRDSVGKFSSLPPTLPTPVLAERGCKLAGRKAVVLVLSPCNHQPGATQGQGPGSAIGATPNGQIVTVMFTQAADRADSSGCRPGGRGGGDRAAGRRVCPPPGAPSPSITSPPITTVINRGRPRKEWTRSLTHPRPGGSCILLWGRVPPNKNTQDST